MVTDIINEGLWRACWQLGVVPKTKQPPALHRRFYLPELALGGLLNIVDSAKDSVSMEWLVHDLALALPQVGQYMGTHDYNFDLRERLSSLGSSSEGDWLSLDATGDEDRWRRHPSWGSFSQLASISMDVAVAAVVDDDSLGISNASMDTLHELHRSYDPEREMRVALVVELAEQERLRRINEAAAISLEERLERAAKIEWAVVATEAERERRLRAESARAEREERARVRVRQLVTQQEEAERNMRMAATREDVAVQPEPPKLYAQDYEVVCAYSVLGCDATLRLSELPAHFETCPFRAEVKEARRRADLAALYNPLNHVVVCPYAVVGCPHSCARADLPAHLSECAFRGDHQQQQQQQQASRAAAAAAGPGGLEYEVVCPYAILGCEQTCLRSDLAQHLAECSFRPRSRQEEDAEREQYRAYALEAEETERVRRLGEGDSSRREDSHARIELLQAISKSSEPESGDVAQLRLVLRRRRVSWVVQAAEIERMRKAEELIAAGKAASSSLLPPVPPPTQPPPQSQQPQPSAQQQAPPPQSQQPQQQPPPLSHALRTPASPTETKASRFASKGHFLNGVLTKQRLQRSFFPEEVLNGRKTHFNSFHDHLEHQGKALHRTLHDELENFGRACALWELSTLDARTQLVEALQRIVSEVWPSKGESPKVCVFGSFASELAVPGVSDLDLVVVDEAQRAARSHPALSSDLPAPPPLNASGSRSSSLDFSLQHAAPTPALTRSQSADLRASPYRPAVRSTLADASPRMGALPPDRSVAVMQCQVVGEALSRSPLLHDVRVIDSAYMPVVKMVTTGVFKLDVDLTVALPSHDGLAVAEFCKTLRARFPQLMPIVRLLKAFLCKRGLSDPYRGGLSSYALVLMTVTSIIKSYEKAGGRTVLNNGELLVDFLDLFGREFDPVHDGIACNLAADLSKLGMGRIPNSGPPLLRIAKREVSCVYLDATPGYTEHVLVVDDPVRPGNNVGRVSFCFPVVQTAFAEALASLLSYVVRNEALGRRKDNHTVLENIFGVVVPGS